jgi:NADPH:quinone reductase-like Zn-dependent oxidoreductase
MSLDPETAGASCVLAYGFTDYGGPDTQQLLHVPVLQPKHGEVLVEVHAAGINPVDWKVREGRQRGFLPLELPSVLGREVAGIVVRTGPGVAADIGDIAVGDRVFGSTIGSCGGYAELALIPSAQAARMPDGLSFTAAAALPIAAATAYEGLAELCLDRGQTLLILGIGGGVGSVATQLAIMDGVTVVGTASQAKRAHVESFGAAAIPYDDDDDDMKRRLELVLPSGADAVLDLVGGDALYGVAGAITSRTRILTVADQETAAHFGGRPLMRLGHTATLSSLAELVVGGKLDPCVRRVFPFSQAADALALVESGHVTGNVVLDGVQSGRRGLGPSGRRQTSVRHRPSGTSRTDADRRAGPAEPGLPRF